MAESFHHAFLFAEGYCHYRSLFIFCSGSITAPTLITCIILALGLVNPLIQALQYTDSLAMVDSTVKEIAILLNTTELNRPSRHVQLKNHHISLKNVCFGYGDVEVLHNVSFDAVPNGITAIVGPSGSGEVYCCPFDCFLLGSGRWLRSRGREASM